MKSSRKDKSPAQNKSIHTKKDNDFLTPIQREELLKYQENPDQIIANAGERATKKYKTFITKNAPGLLDNIDYLNMLKQKIDSRIRDPEKLSFEALQRENQRLDGENQQLDRQIAALEEEICSLTL